MMKNQWHDELISAYLDDELSPDETTRVKFLLESDEQCRKTHDAFLAVRRAVQDYPQEGLSVDLSKSVMMQLGHADSTIGGERAWNLRTTLWSVFVVAAVVLLIVRMVNRSDIPVNFESSQTADNQHDASDNDPHFNNQNLAGGSGKTRPRDGRGNSDFNKQPTDDRGSGGGLVQNDPNSDHTPTVDPREQHDVARATNNNTPNDPLVNNDPATPSLTGPNQLTVVYDVVVNGSPSDDQWLRAMLKECGINIRDGVLTVDDALATKIQNGLITGAVPEDVGPTDPNGHGSSDEPAVRLVYIRSKGAQLEALYHHLQAETDKVKVVVPGIAVNVEQHLMRSAKLTDATAVVIGMGRKISVQFVSSMGKIPKATIHEGPAMLAGSGQDELFGLLVVLRNPASLK